MEISSALLVGMMFVMLLSLGIAAILPIHFDKIVWKP